MVSDSDHLTERIEAHLSMALSSDRPRDRTFHIRSALQFLRLIEEGSVPSHIRAAGYTPGQYRYEFDPDEETATEAVLKAVTTMIDRDFPDRTPLAAATDTDSLSGFVEGTGKGTVCFRWEDLEVKVDASGTVTVTKPGRHVLSQEPNEGSNVLVLDESCGGTVCKNLLSPASLREENILGVLYTPSVTEWMRRWKPGWEAQPAKTGAIAVGESTRSATSAKTTSNEGQVVIQTIADPTDIQTLDTRIHEYLAAWADHGTQTLICFDSLSSLLNTVSPEIVLRFLQSLTHDIRLAEATAHYHLDPREHDDETLATIRPVFDVIVGDRDRV